jgi:hypothetical protein
MSAPKGLASEIINNLGFNTLDEWVAFWTKENTKTGRYVKPDDREIEGLCQQAAAGTKMLIGPHAESPATP